MTKLVTGCLYPRQHAQGACMMSARARWRSAKVSDDLTNRGPADRSRVNVHEPWEVRWWCGEFSCSEQELRDAVRLVGVSAQAVRTHFASKKKLKW